jgi:7-carboxy-7-deazaguanine synthase
MYLVNEIFQTVQGEATWTGSPSIFIRMQGCAVGCPWCDTKHTWAINPDAVVELSAMLSKTADSETYAALRADQIHDAVAATMLARHVVVTGGEPCEYDLTDLCAAFEPRRTVQIETSGTEEVQASDRAWVTLSPKLGMPGGKQVQRQAVARADEIKMPVGKTADIEKLLMFLDAYGPKTKSIWLQPLSQSPKATALCVEAATRHGWRISMQTHKYLGMR